MLSSKLKRSAGFIMVLMLLAFFTLGSAVLQQKPTNENRFQVVKDIDEASKLVSFNVSTLTDKLPDEFKDITPYIYVSFSPFDGSATVVTQVWSVNGKENFIALVQSPLLSGVEGGHSTRIDGFEEDVQIHIVKNENIHPLYIIHWQHEGMGYSLSGTINQDLTENIINELAVTID